MLARSLLFDLDPCAMAEAALGHDLHVWQRSLLNDLAAGKGDRTMVLAPRQSGKSLTTSCAAMWFAVARAPSNILICSPSAAQSGLMLSTLARLLSKLPGGPSFEKESEKRIQLSNGSIIRATHGDERTLRGYSKISFLALDECGSIKDSLISGVSPMLVAARGSWWAIGTPRGANGSWFATTWAAPDDAWNRIRIDVSMCPLLDDNELEKQRRALGPVIFRQEFGLEWLAGSDAAFFPQVIEACFKDNEVKPLWL